MLATALKTWPDNDALKDFALILAARYADPVKAAATLDDPALTRGQSPARLHLLRLGSNARAHSSRATVEAAAGAIKALYVGPDNAFGAAVNFMVIGQIYDSYAGIGEMRTHLRNAPYVYNPSPFFRPFAAKKYRAPAPAADSRRSRWHVLTESLLRPGPLGKVGQTCNQYGIHRGRRSRALSAGDSPRVKFPRDRRLINSGAGPLS